MTAVTEETADPDGSVAAAAGDAALARWLAGHAGATLLALRAADPGTDPAALKARGDRESQAALAAALRRLAPGDAVLSEEAADVGARESADRVWIIDPLDGTREFSEPGRTDWAVHVALWERAAGDLTAGAVALPAQGVVLTTDPPPAPPAAGGGALRLAVSRTRPPAFLAPLRAALERDRPVEPVPMGSAGAKMAAVVQGRVDAYVHAGGQYEWDSAAPVAVARAAGLSTSRVDGSPLRYNRADPWLPDVLVCRPELAEPLLSALSGIAL